MENKSDEYIKHNAPHGEANCIDDASLDEALRGLLQLSLPEAGENEWFTPRVMNRLPERSRWSRVSLWQWVCYLLGAVAMIAAIVMVGRWLLVSPWNLATLVVTALVSLLGFTCAGIMMVPQLVRILREP